jgi:hypothetical protein
VSNYGPEVLWAIGSELVSACVVGQTGADIGPIYQWWKARYR